MLDRAVANKMWLSKFGDVGIEDLVASSSNHHPILLTSKDKSYYGNHRRKVFKFEAKWAMEKDTGQTI